MEKTIVFLPSTHRDLLWFHRYYTSVFPDGRARALTHYHAMLDALKRHPHIGRPADVPGLRELPIARTPFIVVYRIAGDEIQILRIRDSRRA